MDSLDGLVIIPHNKYLYLLIKKENKIIIIILIEY